MAGGEHGHARRRPERLEAQTPVRERRHHEGGVDLAAVQAGRRVGEGVLRQVEGDPLVPGPVGVQHRGGDLDLRADDQAEAQARGPGHAAGRADRRVGGGQGGPRLGQERLPGRRQLHPARMAVEQRRAHLPLQVADLRGQRRLGDAQPLRRPGHVALLGHGDEVAEMVEPDRHRRILLAQLHRA
jgi:hypothetical protein